MGLDRHISELVDILKMEIRSFNTINELLILEEKALISCDSPALADITGRQGDVLSSVACLEKSRLEVIEHIALETGREAREFGPDAVEARFESGQSVETDRVADPGTGRPRLGVGDGDRDAGDSSGGLVADRARNRTAGHLSAGHRGHRGNG